MIDSFKIIKKANLNGKAKMHLLDLWNNQYPEKLT